MAVLKIHSRFKYPEKKSWQVAKTYFNGTGAPEALSAQYQSAIWMDTGPKSQKVVPEAKKMNREQLFIKIVLFQ